MPYLFEVDINRVMRRWISRTRGIWETVLIGNQSDKFGALTLKYILEQIPDETVPSLRVALDYYTLVDSFEELDATPFSFRKDGNKIQVNFGKWINGSPLGYQTPFGKSIKIGFIEGFCDRVDYKRDDKSTYGGVFYDPRLSTLPSLSSKADDFTWGVQAFNDFSVTLINTDGGLDGKEYAGSLGRIVKTPGGGDRSDGKVVALGRIKSATKGEGMSLNVEDMRRKLDASDYLRYFDAATYPNADEDLIKSGDSTPIPIYYGLRQGVEGKCINLNEDNATYMDYVFCDARDSGHHPLRVDRVYYKDDDDNDVVITSYQAVLHDAERGIAYVRIPTDDAPDTVLIDFFGWHNPARPDNPWLYGSELIKDILVSLAGYKYDRYTFLLSNWEPESAKVVEQGLHLSLGIDDATEINSLIGDICNACFIVFTIRPDELFDIRLDTEPITPLYTVEPYERLERTDSSALDNVFSWVKITYGANKDDEQTYIDTSRKTDIEDETGITRCKEAEAIIGDLESAKKYGTIILDRAEDIPEMLELKFPVNDDNITMDFGHAVIAPVSSTSTVKAVYDITAISKDLNDNTAKLTGRYRYSFTYDDAYVQGELCGDTICAGSMPGATEHLQ